jgi:hypothetical protein
VVMLTALSAQRDCQICKWVPVSYYQFK